MESYITEGQPIIFVWSLEVVTYTTIHVVPSKHFIQDFVEILKRTFLKELFSRYS